MNLVQMCHWGVPNPPYKCILEYGKSIPINVYKPSWRITINEPSHEIMALFVLRKHIPQTRMCSHPEGLDVFFFWSDPSSTSILPVCEQRSLRRDNVDAQARLSLRWSTIIS